jgi:hypothetical protein
MRRPWKDQSGQAAVEFILVLPILLLLTFGTIELGIFLQRQLVMGGAGFIAARAAAVSGPETNAAVQETLSTFAAEAQAPWLSKVVSGDAGSVKATKNDDQRYVKLTLQKRESWTGLVAGASSALGGTLNPEVRLAAAVTLNQEYVPGDGARSAARAFTHNLVDYRTRFGKIDTLAKPLSALAPQLGRLPGVGSRAASLAYGLDPTRQAVAENPRRTWNQESRYAGDWYLDRQAEEPASFNRLGPGASNGLGQSARVYQGLKDYQTLANWIYAFKQGGSVDPTLTIGPIVNGITFAAIGLDRTAMTPLANAVSGFVEGTVFQTKAKP